MKPNPAKRNPDAGKTWTYQLGDKLYINLTDRCTLRCDFCPKHNESHHIDEYDLTLAKLASGEDLLAQIGDPTRYSEIVFCGFGESTLRLKVLCEVGSEVRRRGGKVRLNTDGLANLVHKRNVLPALAAAIDSISISLNAQDEKTYQQHCHPAIPNSYAALRAFIEEAPSYISDVTVSAIDGLDGVDIDACQKIAEATGARFLARPYQPPKALSSHPERG